MMALYATLAVTLALLYVLLKRKRHGILNPDGLFVMFQLLMCLGTFYLVDPSDDVERKYAGIILLAYGSYTITSIFVGIAAGTRPAQRRERGNIELSQPRVSLLAWLTVSIVVSVAYYYFVGYNTFLIGLTAFFSDDPESVDIATLRLESYAGSRYLFPGYVNQFKNILLPCLSVIVVHWCFANRKVYRYFAAGVLGLITALLVLGTGQRGAFVVASLIIATYIALATRIRLVSAIIGFLGLFFPFLLLSTLTNQRSSEGSDGSASTLGGAGDQLVSRIFLDNQSSGITGFIFTNGLPVQYGKEWALSLYGLLPGVDGSPLSSQIFEVVYGSTRGTSPPSLVGSIHYNFGTLGVILVPCLIAVLFCALAQFMGSRGDMTSVGMMGVAGVSVICGSWIAGGPDYLLNSGLIPCVVMVLVGSNKAIKNQFESLCSRKFPVTMGSR